MANLHCGTHCSADDAPHAQDGAVRPCRTLTVRPKHDDIVVATSVDGSFRRIQCTPDLLPSDTIGTQIYDASTNSFSTY